MARIIIEKTHPAQDALAGQGIIVCDPADYAEETPLRIGFVNLMPNPVDPVRDFGALFGKHAGQPVQILDFTPTPSLITTDQQRQQYREQHLLPLGQIKDHELDAIILTGFHKEDVAFEDIRFWPEITAVLDYAQENNLPVLASCWGSHAALYHHHAVPKSWDMTDKISGVFAQNVTMPDHPLMRDIISPVTMPVSRYGRSDDSAIENCDALEVLAESSETGIAVATDGRVLYLTGHPEYPAEALAGEYTRDAAANISHLKIPRKVFVNDDPAQGILPASWEKNSGLLIRNWVRSVTAQKSQKRVAPPVEREVLVVIGLPLTRRL